MTRPEISDEMQRARRIMERASSWFDIQGVAYKGELSAKAKSIRDDMRKWLSRQGETDRKCGTCDDTGVIEGGNGLLDEICHDCDANQRELDRLRGVGAAQKASTGEAVGGIENLCGTCGHLGITPNGWCLDCDWRANGLKVAFAYRNRTATPSAVSADAQGVEQLAEQINADARRKLQRSPSPDAAQIVEGLKRCKVDDLSAVIRIAAALCSTVPDPEFPPRMNREARHRIAKEADIADGQCKGFAIVLRDTQKRIREELDRAIAYLTSSSKPELREAMRAGAKALIGGGQSRPDYYKDPIAERNERFAQLLEDAAGAK